MQYHAISCNIMKYHAISCNIMQYHAISCKIMQYHAILQCGAIDPQCANSRSRHAPRPPHGRDRPGHAPRSTPAWHIVHVALDQDMALLGPRCLWPQSQPATKRSPKLPVRSPRQLGGGGPMPQRPPLMAPHPLRVLAIIRDPLPSPANLVKATRKELRSTRLGNGQL